jgi:LCP family protein required for cell wall assembly
MTGYHNESSPKKPMIQKGAKPQEPNKRKSKNKLKRIILVFVLALLGVMIGTVALVAAFIFDWVDFAWVEKTFIPGSDEGEEGLSNRVTFLLIGTDARSVSDPGNTDSIIVVSVDPDTQIVAMMSIPRDSEVLGHTKINSVMAMRGPEGLVDVASKITGVKIDGYMITNFNGFKEVIDTLGGIDVYVEKRMYYETGDKEDGIIDLKKGWQRMDGSKALQYARFRNDAYADITRTSRQQKIIMAVIREALRPANIAKPQLIPQFYKSVKTDLKLSELQKLYRMLKNFKGENTVSTTIPGYFLSDVNGVSFWRIDEAAAKKTMANLLKGISTNRVILGGINEELPVIQDDPEEDQPEDPAKPPARPPIPPDDDDDPEPDPDPDPDPGSDTGRPGSGSDPG